LRERTVSHFLDNFYFLYFGIGTNNISAAPEYFSSNSPEPTINAQSMSTTVAGDVSTQVSNFYSAVRMRSLIESPDIYDKKPPLSCVPPELKMDYSRILNKPYFVSSVSWTTTTVTPGTALATFPIPSGILTNALVKFPFLASTYYRAKIKAILQVSGTPMHQGCLMASVLPPAYPTSLLGTSAPLFINTSMCAPHVFLFANESSPVMVEVPFYANSKLAPVGAGVVSSTISETTNNGDYAVLVISVLNNLACPTSSVTSVSVSVHFVFEDIEFYVPHIEPTWVSLSSLDAEGFIDDLANGASKFIDGVFSHGKRFTMDVIDSLRGAIRYYTGLHSPNYPVLQGRMAVQPRQNHNLVDQPYFLEKMDPYGDFSRFQRNLDFHTDVDEMSISYLASKPQFVGSFVVKTTDTPGTLCWSRPMTPYQEVNPVAYTDGQGARPYTNFSSALITTLARMSRYWKGGLKIHLQAVMSNFHFCKLTLARDYSPDANMLTSYPSFNSIPNLMMETMEFSAGGQVQSVTLPYCSALEQLPCSTDFLFNALSHGMYYIYLHQPLVTNGSVSTSIQFNVYISGDTDFQLFGYASDPMIGGALVTNTVGFAAVDSSYLEAESAVSVLVNQQEDLLLNKSTPYPYIDSDMRPITSLRDYGRRFYRVFRNKLSPATPIAVTPIQTYSLSGLLGVDPSFTYSGTTPGTFVGNDITVPWLLQDMFLGYAGGAKVKIVVTGTAVASCWYNPPHFTMSNGLSFTSSTTNNQWYSARSTVDPGSVSGTNALDGYVKDLFTTVRNQPAVVATYPSWSSQSVMIERSNIQFGIGDMIVAQEDTLPGVNRVATASCTFEFTVPNMSPYKFVGSGRALTFPTEAYLTRTSLTAMGDIVLSMAQPSQYLVNEGEEPMAIVIEIYVAFDDEARLGFQVFAPPVATPAYAVGSGPTTYYQVGNSNPFVPSTGAVNPLAPYSTVVDAGVNDYSSMYYTKTV
jgi:hypothetical protein